MKTTDQKAQRFRARPLSRGSNAKPGSRLRVEPTQQLRTMVSRPSVGLAVMSPRVGSVGPSRPQTGASIVLTPTSTQLDHFPSFQSSSSQKTTNLTRHLGTRPTRTIRRPATGSGTKHASLARHRSTGWLHNSNGKDEVRRVRSKGSVDVLYDSGLSTLSLRSSQVQV
jgi:hypothetical protein